MQSQKPDFMSATGPKNEMDMQNTNNQIIIGLFAIFLM